MKKVLLILTLLLATATAQAEFPYAVTTWGSTQPIQWYYLAFDNTTVGYLYALTDAQSGDWGIKVNKFSYENTDAYKWCFVQLSSGKIAVLNKARMQFLNDTFYFTLDAQSTQLDCVEQTEVDTKFYLCHDYQQGSYYLSWNGNTEYPTGQNFRGKPLHAEAASVDTYSSPTGQVNFSNLNVQDESCSFTCAYSGNESHTLKVYINGTQVENASQYTIERTNQAQEVTVSAEVFFNGNIFPIYSKKIYEVPPVNDIELTFTPYNVNTPNNGNSNEDEDYHKMFDKNRSTKWCVDNTTGSWDTIWVDFMSNEAFIPTGYTMTTGNDTQSWKGRNPKKWKIYAKVHETDEWTTIVDVTDGDAAGLGTANTTDYSFDIDGVSTPYQYFRFEVSEVRGQGGWQNNHYVFQLAELALTGEITTIPEETSETLTVYDGNATNGFVPVYGFYADAYTKCQMIMPASELSDLIDGTISKLTWYLASPAAAAWGGNFQIYISEVSQATCPSVGFLDISGATLVYEGPLDGTGATMEIVFTQGYTYGGGNLLISVYETETGSWKAATFSGTTVTGASVSNYSYSGFEDVSATYRDFLPKTTFTYAPIGGVVYHKPKHLAASDITTNSATITWDAGDDETSWGVEYKKAADEEWTSAGTVTEKTIALDALANGVKYDVRVKSIYANGESGWVQISFSTFACEENDMGEVAYTLTDTYGDGWSNCKLQVYIAGTDVLVQELTMVDDPNTLDDKEITGTFKLCYGVDYDLVWVEGKFAYECGYVLTKPDGEIIAEFHGNGSSGSPTPGVLTTFQIHMIAYEETDMTLTPTTAYTPNNDNSNEDEDYHKLFDKDKSTKWCVVNPSGAWETIWVDFMSNAPFTPISYTMTTGDDTYQHRTRNPKKWKIYAKAHETDDWTTIVDVTDGEAAGLGNKNTTDYSFDIDGVSSPYQYFRFEVSEIGGQDNYNSLNYVFQLAELAMSGYTLAVPGDSNGDSRVDVNDVTTVINYILGKNPSPFNNDAADVNGDGDINVLDVTALINIILGVQ